MKTIHAWGATMLIVLIACFSVVAEISEDAKSDWLQTGMTLAGAVVGLGAGSAIALGFSQDAIDTPLSNTLLLTIPVAAAGAATGAWAGRWMADVVLNHQPSPLWAIVEGGGLGLISGALVGAVTFTLNFVLAHELLEVPEGYWGKFDYLGTVGMAALAGGFWGGFWGLVAGAASVPVLSIIMGF